MMEVPPTIARNIMERFFERFQDRLLFGGVLRSISHVGGMDRFLSSQRVLYKDFGTYVQELSEQMKQHAETVARQAGRPLRYVAGAQESKEEIARQIREQDGIEEGLVCVLTCVEPCQTFFDSQEPRAETVAVGRRAAQVFARVLLLCGSGVWLVPRAFANLAPLPDAGLFERSRIPGAATETGRHRL
jgi:hypothetical protein